MGRGKFKCVHVAPVLLLLDEKPVGRPGWIRSTCAKCGAFIGWRPVESSSKQSEKL